MAKKFVFGLLVGGVAGAAYGLLTTPRTGKENQQLMKEYIEGTTTHVQDVSEKLKDLQTAVQNLTAEGKNFSTVIVKDVQQSVNNFTYEAEPRLRRIQEKADVLIKDAEQAGKNISNALSDEK